MWAPSHSQTPGSLMLEAFDWTSSRPGCSRTRVRTMMSNASLLELPRGAHLLRVHADSHFLHAATFYSRSLFQVEDYKEVCVRRQALLLQQAPSRVGFCNARRLFLDMQHTTFMSKL